MASTQSTNDQISRSRGLLFDGAVCGVGLALFIVAAVPVAMNGLGPATPALLGIPLILIVSRFPMVVDNRDGGIEVGFDSCVLMFLLCTLDAHDALFVWSLGVLLTQLTTGKRWPRRLSTSASASSPAALLRPS